MTIDYNATIGQMLAAMQTTAGKDWKKLKPRAEQILNTHKQQFELIAQLRLTGQVTDEEFTQMIDSEKLLMEASTNALEVMLKVIMQNCINAALQVLIKVVSAAIKPI